MHRNQSVLVLLQEVGQYVEAAVVDGAPQEVRPKEAVEALVIEDEGLPGEEDEQVASVLGEEIEEVILILQGLAFEGEDHSSSSLALRQKAFCAWENTQNQFRPTQYLELNRQGVLLAQTFSTFERWLT